MRIIGKETDFYDYLQNVYPDNSITFDRTDSFILTKEIICRYIYDYKDNQNPYRFILLQVCNTFWLFLLEITTFADDSVDSSQPTNYNIELLAEWKNYDKSRSLIKLDLINFDYDISWMLRRKMFGSGYDKELIFKRLPILIQGVDTNNIKIRKNLNKHIIYCGNSQTEKHIPLLKACGIGNCIDALTVYSAIEEYFSLEKSAQERTTSIGITDNEKIENHGFDTKISFRGKIFYGRS